MLKYLRMGNKRTKAIWWVLVVVVVFTFVGGFIFIFGSGMDTASMAQSGAIGAVNGEPITRTDFQYALEQQRVAYRQRFQSEPGEQEMRMLEAQAWRALVNEVLLDQRAAKLGLEPTDREVVLTLQAAPPQIIATHPQFQTNGQFDPNKYAAALRDPNNNWSQFEELVRRELPVRKLQERLLACVKLSQPELLEAYRHRFERAAVTIVQVPPATGAPVPAPGEADLERTYQKYRGLFAGPERARLEILTVPKRFSEEEVRVAREQAQALVDRARRGEDFAVLARDFSEGPGAEQGGEINRLFQPTEFGADLAPRLASMQKGEISDPIAEPGRFVIIKLLDRVTDPAQPTPGLKLAQILIKVRPNDVTLTEQLAEVNALRDRASRIGLAKAATEKGFTTTRTSFFVFGNTPPQLFEVPDVTDWAFSAKPGEVSSVRETADYFLVAQLADRRDAGPAPKEDIVEQLRQLAESDARLQAARPRADQIVQAVAQGNTLEAAAAAQGITPAKAPQMTRLQPDPHLAASPEIVGAAFGAPIGKILGPLQTPSGWVILRVDDRVAADTTAFDQLKGQISSQILQQKQNEFLQAWVMNQRRGAKVQDLRTRQN